ncbi:hypothetical protein SAMD00019534_010000 [Acytostelium subglobosum LB1]|uniref:hypothetical protein n=1 Tax=Acytostelium subglobosum LB1 TaxID=1410327 RepID=UPI0006450AFA|nr:hypothetical protein SAMD00019534_010000 [Acytostelium subglobosum LB1]GAM17825.1 hypothetical protein SAMD00019534_010000 [Acytostelium subglobosum LB1]|eukprot:XP_012758421.1 hypothetical protein SAMD00019534_010000 [Acytostelium subglobosum LB1]
MAPAVNTQLNVAHVLMIQFAFNTIVATYANIQQATETARATLRSAMQALDNAKLNWGVRSVELLLEAKRLLCGSGSHSGSHHSGGNHVRSPSECTQDKSSSSSSSSSSSPPSPPLPPPPPPPPTSQDTPTPAATTTIPPRQEDDHKGPSSDNESE